MKQLIIFLATFFLSSLMRAVTITEQQRQEALNTTRTFCSLISQYSSGGSSSLDLDQRIFAMSSEDMEAYDNLVSHKHVRFDNFLALITNKFNNRITLEYSDYRIESVNPIYSYNLATTIGQAIPGNFATSHEELTMSVDKLQDIYIVISVKNKVPSLRGADYDCRIIYSVMTKKILSYTDSQGGLICLANAVNAVSRKKYDEALIWIDKALTHDRFTHKKECCRFGFYIASLSLDFGTARKYAQLLKSTYLEKLAELFPYVMNLQYNQTSLNLAKQLYKENCSLFSSDELTQLHSIFACIVSINNYEMENYGEVLPWLDEALKLNPNNNFAKFMKALVLTRNECGTPCEINDPRVMSLLKSSADGGCVQAYLELALCYFKKVGDEQNDDVAIDYLNNMNYYLDKAMKANNLYAYIVRGLLDIKVSDDMTKKKRGLAYLKKAYQSPHLDEAINSSVFAVYFDFLPASREELGQIIAKYEREGLTSSTISSDASVSSHSQQNQSSGTSHPQYQISSSGSSSSTHPSTSTSSTHYNYNKPRRRRCHGPFNAAKTEAFGGFVMGYVQKQWQQHADGESAKFGFWEGHRVVPGIRFGFCYNPQIKYGFGVNYGLNYEFYWSKTNDIEGYKVSIPCKPY